MKKIINVIYSLTIACLVMISCSSADKAGGFTLVMSGNMHGQLDPCG